ncbi:MAG: topoisomerase DNA-binding C4 zinc finger domain-containing protein, partial [Deltaproteobacteria bacterium]|jgi:DNA topoisomerase-1|nr:topoisomerase DNA-binding C4 zinc finger domain-containing protein [Deltaproteobacteria bacterium]
VVERERAIRDFVSVTHYGAELLFDGGWKAVWLAKTWLAEDADYLTEKALAEKAAAVRSLEVMDCAESESRAAPPAPFTTSSLQQAASNALKFTPKHTMELAQRLYEAGWVTYMRTDSPNLSEEAVVEIRKYCAAKGWPLVDKPRVWKSKEGAQEAHEAIRPTHSDVEDAGDTDDEKALYRLIRIRALASQLADAVYAVRVLRLSGALDGKKAEFEARGRTQKDSGWKVLLADDDASSDEEGSTDAPDNPVPSLNAGSAITAQDGRLLTKKTKPPSRYTEAALVRELENRGIGRPATYAAILDTILRREYVRTEKRQLVPTPLGEKVVALLAGAFTFLDYDFTKGMESALDDIAGGRAAYRDVLAGAYDRLLSEVGRFAQAFPVAEQSRREPPAVTEFSCAVCGKPLVHMKGQKKDGSGEYDFFTCSDRKCNASYPNVDGKPGEARKKPEATKFKCKACGKPLVRRESAKGPFFGCSGYPACKQLYQDKDGKPDFGGKK